MLQTPSQCKSDMSVKDGRKTVGSSEQVYYMAATAGFYLRSKNVQTNKKKVEYIGARELGGGLGDMAPSGSMLSSGGTFA